MNSLFNWTSWLEIIPNLPLLPAKTTKPAKTTTLAKTTPQPASAAANGTRVPRVTPADLEMGIVYKMAFNTLHVLGNEKIALAEPANGEAARGSRWVEIPFNLDIPSLSGAGMRKVFNEDTLRAIQAATRVDNVIVRQEKDQIIFQYQLDRIYWQFFTRSDLSEAKGIGYGAGRNVVTFELGQTLVAGASRSGKTVTVETIIFAMMFGWPSDRLKVAIVDTHHTLGTRKEGLIRHYVGDFTNAAHLWCPVAYSDEEAGLTITAVYNEFQKRKENDLQDEYALVLVVDELMDNSVLGVREKGKYTHEDRLTMISDIARFGAKFNMYVVVGAQDPKIADLGSLMRYLLIRYVGHVTDGQASRNLTGVASADAHKLGMGGDFLKISPEDDKNEDYRIRNRFQVAEPTERDFAKLVRVPHLQDPRLPEESPTAEEEDISHSTANDLSEEDLEALFNGEGVMVFKTSNREIVVDPYTAALYAWRSFTMSQALSFLGIKRRVHEKTRAWVAMFLDELRRLKEGYEPRSPFYQAHKKRAQRKNGNVSVPVKQLRKGNARGE